MANLCAHKRTKFMKIERNSFEKEKYQIKFYKLYMCKERKIADKRVGSICGKMCCTYLLNIVFRRDLHSRKAKKKLIEQLMNNIFLYEVRSDI